MASSRLAFEGPIVKDKVSFIVGSRISYMDWILDLVKNIDIQRSKAQFYDLTAKIDAQLSSNTNMGASVFLSGDEFKFADQVNFEYSTETATFYLNHLINDNFNLKLTANIGEYQSSLFDINGLDVSKFTNKVQYLRPALRAFYQVNEKTELILGAEMNQFTVSPGEIAPDSDESITIPKSLVDEKGVAISPFIQFKMDVSDDLSLQAALRYTSYNRVGPTTVSLYAPDQIKTSSSVIGEEIFGDGEKVISYDGLEPRISLRYSIDDNSAIKAGFNRSFQYLNQISNTSSSTPVDIWQLSDFHIKPQQAYNYSLGYFRNFNDDKITSSLTGFYRDLDKVVEYKDFATLLLNDNIERELVDAIGRSYGAEFNLEIKNDKNRFLMNYTYSRSERQVLESQTQAAVNNGEWFPSNYDKPHALNITWSKKVGRISDLSVNFTYSTGRPTTVPISSFSADNVLNIPIYSDRNEFRIPDYHRLDAAYTVGPFGKAGGRVEHNVTFSVYNLYSRENALFGFSMIYTACIDEISFDIASEETSIVVEGLISTELKEYAVRINESTILGIGIDNIKRPISGANVEVVDDDGASVTFTESTSEAGTYTALTQGVVGKSYHVEVTMPNGNFITSAPEEILPPVEIDSIPIRVEEVSGLNASGNSEITGFVIAEVNFDFDPNDRPYLRWRTDGEYEFQELAPMLLFPNRCYVKDFIDFNNLALLDASEVEGSEVANKEVVRTTLNRRLHVIYGFMVTQYRISQREHEYWEQVDQLINIDGTIFDPPPATIVGNLANMNNPDELIQGYFSVVSQDFKRQFIETGDLGFFVQTDCSSFSSRPGPPECAQCTIIPNSSLTKPPYWPF